MHLALSSRKQNRSDSRSRFLQLSKRSILAGLLLASLPSASSMAQQPPQPLPLPAHPNRQADPEENSLPKASQPDRETRHTQHTSVQRQGPSLPVPGRPSRNLPPIGIPDDEPNSEEAEGEGEDEELAEEELPSGLLNFLPHHFRSGAMTFEYIYTGETFTKAFGGINPGIRPTNYRSNFDLVSTLDTEKMGWWTGGRFLVYGQNLTGRPLSATEVGDFQLFSNLDSTISATDRADFTTVAEYWYEHVAMDQRLRFKIGKQDANADFALTDLGGEFVHSSFGLPPMIPLPTFPSQALGVATFLNITEPLTFGFGIYDGTLPSGPQGVRWGFDTLGHNGAISLYQLQWQPQFGFNDQLPTTLRTGMWHHSGNDLWTELTANPNPRLFNQNYGVFTTWDQMIFKEEYCTENDQGLGIFFQFGWAPGNRNAIQEYYGGGLVYKGLLPCRDQDVIGLGFANALFSGGFQQFNAAQAIPMGKYETAVELFYKYQVGNYMSLQPDIQYIANPSGQYADALVPGMRFEIVF